MNIFITIILFIASLILIVKGSDYFVQSSSKIAKLLGVSEFFIGMTLVAIGTSLPELATAISAAITKNTGLLLGNIWGASIADIGLVLGIGTAFVTISVKKDFIKKDILFLLGMEIVFLILSLRGVITWIEGILFLIIFFVYLYISFKKPKEKDYRFKKMLGMHISRLKNKNKLPEIEKQYEDSFEYSHYKEVLRKGIHLQENSKKIYKHIFMNIGVVALSLTALLIGAHYLVSSAVSIAKFLKISQEIIGLSIVSVGTTLPELGVTIRAMKKNLGGIFLGNIVGSVIFNLLFITGVSSFITPLVVAPLITIFVIPFMILMTLFLYRFTHLSVLSRTLEGVVLIIFYLVFLLASFFLAGVFS